MYVSSSICPSPFSFQVGACIYRVSVSPRRVRYFCLHRLISTLSPGPFPSPFHCLSRHVAVRFYPTASRPRRPGCDDDAAGAGARFSARRCKIASIGLGRTSGNAEGTPDAPTNVAPTATQTSLLVWTPVGVTVNTIGCSCTYACMLQLQCLHT